MLEELRGDAQTTLAELRELAHGIYPPLLRDRGLAEALRTAANRAVLPTEVTAEGIEDFVVYDRAPDQAELTYRITLGDRAAGLRLVAGTLD